ncbi:SAM-dependent methyltransferase [Geotalea daltonii FRC-32]|uniref:SAM-dependent methyltransferase n=1 Tax=Geotalea daltonii (strain DSM 22248 / JCM 15807 / FRC-32) TaxID=316067 RepID=B9M045_GEODF|nr:methyltransferase domain-containing protein [Geotalea daltonii]ACM20825.1 SAM-dependent methyltransferase [Geotalea daltonii FRC-32]
MKEPYLDQIRTAVRQRYDAVARSPRPLFQYPTGREGMLKLGYGEEFIDSLPASVAESFCGVGNPLLAGKIRPGETVLDVGCGAGVDIIRAAGLAGPDGKVYGVDLTSSMVERAADNIKKMQIANAWAEEGAAESLPFPDKIFDVVTSNGVLNLSPEKRDWLGEIHRVLKPGGRLYLADMILEDGMAGESPNNLDAWSA